MSEENKNPCTECRREPSCVVHSGHRQCESWLKWYSEEWRKVRNFFGIKCVDSTLKEKECDNEDS